MPILDCKPHAKQRFAGTQVDGQSHYRTLRLVRFALYG
jgi:hypothetical protein